MQHPDGRIEVVGNGQVAPGAAGGQHLRPGLPDTVHLPFRDLSRDLGVFHLERTSAAAAVACAREFHIFHAGYRLEEIPGLGADLLTLHQVAGIMVGHADLLAASVQLREPLLMCVDKDGHIRKLAGQQLRRLDLLILDVLAQLTQVAEQVGVFVLERCTAGGAVDDDGVHVRSGKEFQGVPDALD